MKKKKSETEILSPEIEVGKYKVRPWAFDQFISILPSLVGIGEILKEKKISLDDIESLKKDAKKITELIVAVGSFIPEIVAKTLRVEVKEVNRMDFDQATTIALLTLIQNAEKLKNFSGLGKSALRSLMSA